MLVTSIVLGALLSLAAGQLRLKRLLAPWYFLPIAYVSFYGVGVLPISSYRGIIIPDVYAILGLGALGTLCGVLSGGVRRVHTDQLDAQRPEQELQRSALILRTIAWICLIISWLSLAQLLASHGALQGHATTGSNVSAYVLYLIEWSFPGALLLVTADMIANHEVSRTTYATVTSTCLLLALVGYRTMVLQVVVGLLILEILLSSAPSWTRVRARFVALAAMALFLLNAGFVARRVTGTTLQSVDDAVRGYELVTPSITAAIMPLHLAGREGPGLLTQLWRHLDTIGDSFPREFLFFADFLTLLPGEQPSAGTILKGFLGSTTLGGLAPSLTGGLYLAFGAIGVAIGTFLIGHIAARAYRLIQSYGREGTVLYAAILTLYVHLLYRGLFKPAYVMHLAIIYGALAVARIAVRRGARA